MPRDANGNMTLPAGNPVVLGTNISPDVMNATLADLAAEIQDSLSRSGKGGMSVPMTFTDGSVGAPGIAFASETNTGWFRQAAGEIRAAILGVWRLAIKATGIVVNGDVGSTTVTATGAVTGGSLATAGNLTLGPGSVIAPTSGSVTFNGLADPAAAQQPVTLNYLTNTYVTGSLASSLNVNLTLGAPEACRDTVTGRAWIHYPASTGAGYTLVSGNLNDAGDDGLGAGATLFTLPVGFRPVKPVTAPVTEYRPTLAAGSRLIVGWVFISTAGVVTFHNTGIAGGALSMIAGDQFWFGSIPPWSTV